MNQSFGTEQAGEALAEIGKRRDQVVEAVTVPAWYWCCVGVLTVALGVVVDRRRPVELAIAIPVYAVVIGAATVWMILGRGRVQASRDLLGARGALRITSFVGLVVGASLMVGFGMRAAGFTHPATAATLVAGVAVAAGGPLLMTGLRRTMLRRTPSAIPSSSGSSTPSTSSK